MLSLGIVLKQKCFCAVKLQTFCQKIKIKLSALLSKNRPNVRPRRLQINKSWISRKWLDKNNKYRALLIINTAWSIELLLYASYFFLDKLKYSLTPSRNKHSQIRKFVSVSKILRFWSIHISHWEKSSKLSKDSQCI